MKPGLCYPCVRLALLGAAVLLAALTGCSNASRYPKDLKYPVRKDLIVLEQPKAEPRQLPPPGQLDESIARNRDDKDAKFLDPAKLSSEQRGALRAALDEVFGTPAAPRVAVIGEGGDKLPTETAQAANRRKYTSESGQQLAVGVGEIDDLELDAESLRRGSGLYRRHCLHCHGVAGDGRGPTGPWVHPHPRDYRPGKFKFISTPYNVVNKKPRRDDLLRTLARGIDGTSMPAFGLLPERQLAHLASYVTHLSIRGEVEFDTMKALLTGEDLLGGSIETHVPRKAAEVVVQWANSNATSPSKPPAYPEKFLLAAGATDDARKARDAEMQKSISNGYKLFLGRGGCAACHTDFGRQAPYKFDEWGTLVRPRNLTEGQFRGGRRPLDLYWRMNNGIGPSGMSGLEDKLNDNGEVWDLIHFVQALPFPAMLPPDVRENIYGKGSTPPAVARASHP